MADRYFDFRAGNFTGVDGRPVGCRKESVLAAMLVWRRHIGARERVDSARLPAEVGVGAETVEAYRSTLRRLFATSGLQPFDEDRPYNRSALGARTRIPSDLADLLEIAQDADNPRRKALVEDPHAWDEFRQLLLSRPRGRWAEQLEQAIRDAHRSRRAPRTTEPPPRCEIFGRSADLDAIASAFDRLPVVVLHGVSGIGKTALATEYAHRHVGARLWVELTDVEGDDDRVGLAVARSLGFVQVPNRGVAAIEDALAPNLGVAAIADALDLHMGERGPMLVVLDDCRSRSEACRELIVALRDHCRRGGELRFLVTSQAPLGLDPDLEHDQAVKALPKRANGRDPAVDLFVFAAQAKSEGRQSFNSADLAQIARVCEGQRRNPLGIMLEAADFVQGTGLEQLVEREAGDDDFERALERGFNRLPPTARRLLARLGVFGGPFAFATAAEVVEMTPRQLEQAAKPLIGTYIVPVESAERTERYELERSVRRVAERALDEFDSDGSCRRRLLEYLLDHFRYVPGTSRITWRTHVQPELETAAGYVRAALDSQRPMGEQTLELILKLVPLWVADGRFEDANRLLESASSKVSDREDMSIAMRARIACAQGTMCWYRHDLDCARDYFDTAYALAKQTGDPVVVAEAHVGRGLAYDRAEDFEAAAELLDALGELPDAGAAATAAAAHTGIGWRRYHQSRYAEAWEQFNIAEGIASSAGEDSETIYALLGLGWLSRRRCDFVSADEFFSRATGLAAGLGDRNLRATVLNARGELAHAMSDLPRARELLEQGRRLAAVSHVNVVGSRLEGSDGELRRAAAETFSDLQAARRLLISSRDAAVRHVIDSEEAWRYFGLGLVEFLLEAPQQARARFETSRAVAKRYRDTWQIARCDQRLARLELVGEVSDEQLLGAIGRLLDAARTQDGLRVLDDLSWTVQDLAYGAYRLGAPQLAAQLTGARFHLDMLMRRARTPILRSAKRDWYADELLRACDAAHAQLGDGWDSHLAAGEQRAAACPYRSLCLVLDDVEAWAAERGGEASRS